MPHVFNYEKNEFEQIHFNKAVKLELLTSHTCFFLTLCMRGASATLQAAWQGICLHLVGSLDTGCLGGEEISSGVDWSGTPICIRHVSQHCAVAAEIRVRHECLDDL